MEEILDAITVEFNSDEDNSSKGSDEELLSLSVLQWMEAKGTNPYVSMG
jgi:hypothetical protein